MINFYQREKPASLASVKNKDFLSAISLLGESYSTTRPSSNTRILEYIIIIIIMVANVNTKINIIIHSL